MVTHLAPSNSRLYDPPFDWDPSMDFPSDTEDSDACSLSSSSIFSSPPSPSTPRTSYVPSARSASPAPSVLSMTSSMRAQAFKHEYGRGLNNYSEVYRLPADDEELERLDAQHLLFMEIMGKYPPCMEEVMADDVPGEIKAVLDLGCGSGSWIMDVARDFAHCSAVAVDLVPMQSIYMPPNLRSEVDDINLGLEHFYGDFNVVHARLISSGVRDYEGLINQISMILRPGGLIDLMEFDFHVYDENHQVIELETSKIAEPWWPRWLTFANLAARDRGGNVDAATYIHSWVANHHAFENVTYEEYWVPTCGWRTDSEFMMRIGVTLRDDILAFLKSGRPLLLGSGVPEDLVNELEANAVKELHSGRARHYIRLQCVHARKKRN
ncbi:MAG: hypothetical protein NXY57DRAFT_957277 [Lentinula lateritia]|uniref:S-adenosyl-L-methionine-dependent methyltransferase n=1 Tax=Lentinula lateritia TaxID=40482 RepID=A0ABQ8V0Y2_9AGAR|nr:MAG: hypothetical protein NXY57DRAFT_957277 [Lentinula lateritia]KAJ4468570.1 hypothetical protein C8R41DRAFT_38154 [Lentinula lateritia]